MLSPSILISTYFSKNKWRGIVLTQKIGNKPEILPLQANIRAQSSKREEREKYLCKMHKYTLSTILMIFCLHFLYGQNDTNRITIPELLIKPKGQDSYIPFSTSKAAFKDKKKTALGVRYYNFGCVKTPSFGFWKGQKDKDARGHAIFEEPVWGIRAFIKVCMKQIVINKKNTPFKFMSIYAPPSDCVGSIRNADGTCMYGYNPTELYAQKVATSLGIGINDTIPLLDENGKPKAQIISILFSAIATMELGKPICQDGCKLCHESI